MVLDNAKLRIHNIDNDPNIFYYMGTKSSKHDLKFPYGYPANSFYYEYRQYDNTTGLTSPTYRVNIVSDTSKPHTILSIDIGIGQYLKPFP